MQDKIKKALVLSSGGVDSTTCIAKAIAMCGKQNVVTVSLYYGQKHDKELECARKIADYYGLKHYEEDISNVMKFAGGVCTLVKNSLNDIPEKSYAEQIKENGEGRVSTYVPFRNGLLLSIATALADSLFPDNEVVIFYGAHADDAAGQAYADCSPEFAQAMDVAIRIGTYGKIKMERPFIDCTKSEVVKYGLQMGVPYELTWSCYRGGDKPCGKCGTCIDRAEAFRKNGVQDPAIAVNADEINKFYVTWDMVQGFIEQVAKEYKNKNVSGVYGLPRGGLVLAVMLSHRLNIPLLAAPVKDCIIIDDICDSGESLLHYVKNSSSFEKPLYHIITLFYNPNNIFKIKPDKWEYIKNKNIDWVVFPWEEYCIPLESVKEE